MADDYVCDFNMAVIQSPLLLQGFTDNTSEILGNAAQSQKARGIMPNVQRVFLHPSSQSIVMYGWNNLPGPLKRDQEKMAFLMQRMEQLKKEAANAGYPFDYKNLVGKPTAVVFNTKYTGKSWPQREIGMESVFGSQCWLVIKVGGNMIADKNADADFIKSTMAEFERIRGMSGGAEPGAFPVLDSGEYKIGSLPGFDAENFWAIAISVIILALLFGIIIGRAASCADNKHTRAYFKLMAALWLVYAMLISVFKDSFVTHDFALGLEHYVYAALMIAVNALGILLGPVMALPSVALALGHAVRTVLFILLNYNHAPRIVWLDIGLMILMAIYILTFGFRRKIDIARTKNGRANIVERHH